MTVRHLTIDLVTVRSTDGAFILVVVEEGPWSTEEIEVQLRRIQDRLYDCVDAAIDGHLASKYPESYRKPVVIRLDCYDTPEEPVRKFMERFTESIASSEEIQRDLVAQEFVTSLGFEYNRRSLQGSGQQSLQ